MFLNKYLDNFAYEEIIGNYNECYLCYLDENNFIQIYNVFKKYDFYFINDIIVNFLEIFSLDKSFVERKILELKEELGEKFVYIIGNDMRYLEKFIIER